MSLGTYVLPVWVSGKDSTSISLRWCGGGWESRWVTWRKAGQPKDEKGFGS